MNELERILEELKQGAISIYDARQEILKISALQVSEHTLFDLSRERRVYIPEIVYAETKTLSQIIEITRAVTKEKEKLLLSRVPPTYFTEFKEYVMQELSHWEMKASKDHRTILLKKERDSNAKSITEAFVIVIAGGTSDLPVYEEVMLTLEFFEIPVKGFIDVGIAGIHRLQPVLKFVEDTKVDFAIVIAGMEGALPTVINSLISVPVIGVPTSVGYGLGGKGITALLSMLQSCSPGLVVVNIDGGIQAASFVAKAIRHNKGVRV